MQAVLGVLWIFRHRKGKRLNSLVPLLSSFVLHPFGKMLFVIAKSKNADRRHQSQNEDQGNRKTKSD